MIISASYKTDIPTFYGEWFINRLRSGYCKTLNPYNRRIQRIPFDRQNVSGFVFWTKNIGPFLAQLAEVHDRGFPFIVQHTINGYPRAQQAVVDAAKSVANLKQLAEMYGPRVCVWRYDTIINSSVTSREFHVETFSEFAKQLEGTTDEVGQVSSFTYTRRRCGTCRARLSKTDSHGPIRPMTGNEGYFMS